MVEKTKTLMKIYVTIIASLLLAYSTVVRVKDGLNADVTLCGAFVTIAGFIWGANLADLLKKK